MLPIRIVLANNVQYVSSPEIQSGFFTRNVLVQSGSEVEKCPHPGTILARWFLTFRRYQLEGDGAFSILLHTKNVC